MLFAVGQLQYVVEEAVFIVPQRDALLSDVVHGAGNAHKVFEEFAGDVFVGGIFFGKFESDGQHVQAKHGHPAGAVRLLEMPAGRQRRRTIKHPDIVKTEESALENIHAIGIFAVDPPGEIEQQLVKNFFEKAAVGDAAHSALDFVNAPRRPSMHRRIYIAKRPLICGKLPIRIHVPFTQK